MKKFLIASVAALTLSACSHANAPRAGEVPAAEPALALGIFAVAACFILEECS